MSAVTPSAALSQPWDETVFDCGSTGYQLRPGSIMLRSALFPPRSRSQRLSVDSHPTSPTDSGYGSAAASPTIPEYPADENGRPFAGAWVHCDGHQSDSDDPFVDGNHAVPLRGDRPALSAAPAPPRSPDKIQKKSKGVPPRPTHARPPLPAPLYPGAGARIQPRGLDNRLLHQPDRFIPARPQGAEPCERFRTSKTPKELTPAERLLRHNAASEDPFCYRTSTVVRVPSPSRSSSHTGSAASRNRGQPSNTARFCGAHTSC